MKGIKRIGDDVRRRAGQWVSQKSLRIFATLSLSLSLSIYLCLSVPASIHPSIHLPTYLPTCLYLYL